LNTATRISQRCWLELWRPNSETGPPLYEFIAVLRREVIIEHGFSSCLLPYICFNFNFQLFITNFLVAELGVLTVLLTSCTDANNSYVKTIFNKQIFINVFNTLKHFSMPNVWHYQSVIFFTLSMPFHICNNDVVKRRGYGRCQIEHAMGKKTGDGGYFPTCLSFCRWVLLIVTANAIFIVNRLLLGVKGLLGSNGHNWILGVRIVPLEPVTSAAMQCSCKPLTIMCCHHRRSKEANSSCKYRGFR
jgi:hypothetical protein